MSAIPPRLEAEPGTPAREWAVKNTSAFDTQPPPAVEANASTMNPTTAQLFEQKNMRPGTVAEETVNTQPSAVSTPGNEFPGAYPHKQDAKPAGSEITAAVTDTASKIAQTVSQTAQTYGPMAAETITQYLPKSVADKVSEYSASHTHTHKHPPARLTLCLLSFFLPKQRAHLTRQTQSRTQNLIATLLK